MTAVQKPALPPSNQRPPKGPQSSPRKPGLTVLNAKPHVRSCSYCNGEQYISACDQFRACSIDNRHAFVSEKQLCYNCLGVHRLNDCRSKVTCASCQRRHHTLLHRNFQRSKVGNPQPQAALTPGAPQPIISLSSGPTVGVLSAAAAEPSVSGSLPQVTNNGVTSHATQTPPGPQAILLATARVSVFSKRNRASLVRALIDPCSEASFMIESLAQRLRTPRQSTFAPVTGVGGTRSYTARSKATIFISPHFRSDSRWRLITLILPRLTDYVPSSRPLSNTSAFLEGLTLADPQFNSTDAIELIIGADLYPQLIEESLRKGPDKSITAQATRLGWILTGSSLTSINDSRTISSLQCHADLDLAALLTRFWQQEEAESETPIPLTEDERECEDHFIRTHTRNADGRYVLRLPFKSNLPDLGDSREAALSALHRTEIRFKKQPEFGEKYHKFMRDYISLGHMKEFSTLCSVSKDFPSFFLPHHGVFKTHGDTSKLRVVFNGSVKLSSGLSINECLHIGPKLQLDPFDVLLRWRIFRYVSSTDIEKMFRQILIAEENQVFQQILWYVGLFIMIYNLCIVTHGLGPSPYQAIRTLQQLAADEGARFSRAARILLKQTYIDDIFAGADTLEKAIEIRQELVSLLKAGGFPLSKWTANHPSLLSDVPEEQQATHYLSCHESETTPMLGVAWQLLLDVFCFQFNFLESEKVTKRSALSIIAQLYDPLGWITPVTILFKIFMQSLWHDGVEWDEDFPTSSRQRWNLLIEDLLHVQHFSMPRWIGYTDDLEFSELHGFSDASERAFAACLYLRTVDKEGNVKCILLTSKSKVAPLKQVSLPRLELCCAVLLVRLAHRVRRTLSLENSRCYCWSDSTITIAWIKEAPTN